MTKLLDEAIKRVREPPEAIQNKAAEILFAVAAKRAEPVHLDDDTRKAVLESSAQARRGEFASDAEIAAFLRRQGG
jgi:hypothetical protein